MFFNLLSRFWKSKARAGPGWITGTCRSRLQNVDQGELNHEKIAGLCHVDLENMALSKRSFQMPLSTY
jgi:hypothetical protein